MNRHRNRVEPAASPAETVLSFRSRVSRDLSGSGYTCDDGGAKGSVFAAVARTVLDGGTRATSST